MKKIYSILFLLFLSISSSYAATIKGGNIHVSSENNLTFHIRVQLYMDVTQALASKGNERIQICFGDSQTGFASVSGYERLPDNKTVKAIYETKYTYAESGIYQIGVTLRGREGVYQNLIDAESSDIFLWTVVNTAFTNSTPNLITPSFEGGVKQNFLVDFQQNNTDQDSISVRLQSLSKRTAGTCGVRDKNHNYFFPNDVTKNGTFKIDPFTKQLTWTAPEKEGEYLYAYVVDEWRDGIKISESYHEASVRVQTRTGTTVEIPAYEPAIESILLNPIEDIDKIKLHLSAYPVPTQDFLTVQIVATNTVSSSVQIQLINIQGKVVQEIKKANLTNQAFVGEFDMRSLSSGVYIIRASNGEFTTSQKVVR
jgi:hypothetical protein